MWTIETEPNEYGNSGELFSESVKGRAGARKAIADWFKIQSDLLDENGFITVPI